MARRDLILGLAAGYHAGDLRPFAASLRASGFAGRCVLFVSASTTGAGSLAGFGIEAVPFERPAHQAHVPYNAWRYFLYRDFLRANPKFGRVLLTDVRDVVFQADPFSFGWPEGFCAMLEDPSATVGSCAHTAHWVRGHLGQEALADLAAFPLSCSGVSLASALLMLAYLERLCARLLPFTPGPRMAGYDQGVHNLVLRRDPPGPVRFFGNDGPVLTLGSKPDDPAVAADGLVLNDAGMPAILVHQYDRKPELFARIRKRYA